MTKVFGIGFHKTGTSSLGTALEVLGYRVCSAKMYLVKQLEKNNVEPALELAEQYDAFQDFPWPLIFKEPDEQYPNSKFILTIP